MMPLPPFLNFPSFRSKYYTKKPNIVYNQLPLLEEKLTTPPQVSDSVSEEKNIFFEIFGIKLFYDDILIICLLFFLYTEGIDDQLLFIALILLLLS